jgi:retron-type reverse transcriptase
MGLLDWLRALFVGSPGPGRYARFRNPRTDEPLPTQDGARREAEMVSRYAAKGGNAALFIVARRLALRRKRLAWLLWIHPDNYHSFEIPKRDGTARRIDVPSAALKFVQRRILRRILNRVPMHPYAHGFRRRRSIFSNARPHAGREMVLNLDLKDFFPSITFPRVRGLFQSLGFDRAQAVILAKLTTYEDRLPQGAPTSPAISNAVCRKLDRRLAGLAGKAEAAYTRYADDLTFSGPSTIRSILPAVRRIIIEEGFRVAEHKGRVTRRCRRQIVTGLTVNERVNVSRRKRRLIRAMVHNAVRNGLKAENRNRHPDYWAYLLGNILFIRMAHPAEGDRLLAQMARMKW